MSQDINQYAKFKGYRCFKDEWAGFEKICPINVIIGRNNTGKSSLLDLVQLLTTENFSTFTYKMQFRSVLQEAELRRPFPENTSGGHLGGNHWGNHGRRFVGASIQWEVQKGNLSFQSNIDLSDYKDLTVKDIIKAKIGEVLKTHKHLLYGKSHKRISAERDINEESAGNGLNLDFSGMGASNICRRYITGANEKYPRTVIQTTLLMALNHIFGKDANFTEIQVQQHDEETHGNNNDWEIYLHEETKGLIPLSSSGSGLKTVILVLLNLLVVPHFEEKRVQDYVFSFEELENNLHPALQRRLFSYISKFAIDNDCHIFLTTHSNVVLDVFTGVEHAQIMHVEHDGKSATAKTVDAYFEQLEVVNDLGVKASDLLQANGIVWMEGPSDRIYFNKWIELLTKGSLKEGLDYQCAFYGGSILSHYTADPTDPGRLNLLQVNPNAVLIADGDRTAQTGKGSRVKSRVSDIKKEIKKLPKSYVWITVAKEVESYIPLSVLQDLFHDSGIPAISQYEPFSKEASKLNPTKGYFQLHSPTTTFNKVNFAQEVITKLELPDLKATFEWQKEMEQIVQTILSWNER